jgi:uncharacterized protein (TIGR00251 family)
MKFFIIAKPNASEQKVEKIDDSHFKVSVKEPPVRGEANRAIIKALADYFNVAPGCVIIASGHTSKQKIIKVLQ